MNTRIGILFALLACTAVAQNAPAPAWRLDYYHTGGPNLEVFSLDGIVVEPVPFSGHPSGFVDPVSAGGYRFEIRNSAGKVLYARGFSSIFAEWITTEEATKFNRTFHESVRFPAPSESVTAVFLKRGANNELREVWRQEVDPANLFIRRAAPPRQNAIEIERHGDPQDKLDILLLGDGYTAADRNKFMSDARRLTDEFFRHEPFRSQRDRFNIWGICPESAESGISRPSTGVHRSNPLGTTYDAFGSERYVLTFENRAMRDIACWAPYEFVEILVNNETYGGGGIYNLYATVSVDNDWANYIFVHEFGHHLAGLADEYYTSPVAYQPPADIVEPWEPNVTALSVPAALKWRDLVSPGTSIPTTWPKDEFEQHAREIQKRRGRIRAERRPESEMSALFLEQQLFESKLLGSFPESNRVGAFQGANYDAKAFYRSQADCIMFSRDDVPFCAVCRRALERVIALYAPR
ncbi:MAG TPA: peptidase M64 [Elusimicrobia bacterium]|nr:peptidase M64 [Elusimicrobiota bacterium]